MPRGTSLRIKRLNSFFQLISKLAQGGTSYRTGPPDRQGTWKSLSLTRQRQKPLEHLADDWKTVRFLILSSLGDETIGIEGMKA